MAYGIENNFKLQDRIIFIKNEKGKANCQMPGIPDVSVSYTSQDARWVPPVLGKLYGDRAHCLDLSFNRLESLQGLHLFTALTELVLDNNELTDSLQLPSSPSLITLSLNNNKITNIEMLVKEIKSKLKNLQYLSLLGNIACPNQLSDSDKDEEDYQRYRYYVLHYLPGLRFLDSRAVSVAELMEAKRIGHLMRVARPSYMNGRTSPIHEEVLKYSPLSNARICREPQGVYGKCIYRYTGKHSEGNRFIRNHQL